METIIWWIIGVIIGVLSARFYEYMRSATDTVCLNCLDKDEQIRKLEDNVAREFSLRTKSQQGGRKLMSELKEIEKRPTPKKKPT